MQFTIVGGEGQENKVEAFESVTPGLLDWTITSRDEVFKQSREVVEPFKTWLIRGLRE